MLARRFLLTATMAAALASPTIGVVAFAADAPAPLVTVVNPYAPSGVGEGDNQGSGKAPANGTVGKADAKNPPGQAPNGTDANAGYECDRNSGVGNNGGNPAHSGCRTPSPSPSTSSPSPSSTTTTSPSPSRTTTTSPSPSTTTTTSPSPTTTTSPSPSSTTTTSPSPSNTTTTSPSPATIISGGPSEQPVVGGPSKKPGSSPIASVTPEQPVCLTGPCYRPTPPALPFTGARTDAMLLLGGEAVLVGLLLLLLGNLATQVRKLILIG